MDILAAKAQEHCSEFRVIIKITDAETKFEFQGGESVSPDRIGIILCGILGGQYNAEIIDALESWGDNADLSKVIKIIHAWTNMQEMSRPKRKYCVDPRQVFAITNNIPGNHQE